MSTMNAVSASLLSCDSESRQLIRAQYDRKPFAFKHNLHNSKYFSWDAIMALAARMAPKANRWYFEEGDTKPKNGWSGGDAGRTLTEILAGIGENRSLVLLKRVHEDPEYKEILETLGEELSDMLGFDLGSRYYDGLMTLIIASPGRITPYHLDGDSNMLMQIRGTKSLYVFDRNDREVLPSHELEGFWSGDIKAPTYKEHLQNRACEYAIGPGDGVHNPVTYPHWAQNGPEISIALSVNFKRVIDNVADSYKVNSQLRKLGLHPLEPGRVKTVDHLKGLAYRTVKQASRYLKK